MDRILKILKKENGPRASSAPALELNTIIFKHVYWYMQQISGERLQDHWSSGLVYMQVYIYFILFFPGFSILNVQPMPHITSSMLSESLGPAVSSLEQRRKKTGL